MDFLGIGPWEAILILIIAMIFVGPGKIVQYSRTLGKWMRAIKTASSDFTSVVTREVEKAEKEAMSVQVSTVPKTAPPPPAKTTSPQRNVAGEMISSPSLMPAEMVHGIDSSEAPVKP